MHTDASHRLKARGLVSGARRRAGSRIESTRSRSSERPTIPIAAASLGALPCSFAAACRRNVA